MSKLKAISDTAEGRAQWVLDIIRRESQAGTYGVVSVHLEGGTITRVKTEKSEIPEN